MMAFAVAMHEDQFKGDQRKKVRAEVAKILLQGLVEQVYLGQTLAERVAAAVLVSPAPPVFVAILK